MLRETFFAEGPRRAYRAALRRHVDTYRDKLDAFLASTAFNNEHGGAGEDSWKGRSVPDAENLMSMYDNEYRVARNASDAAFLELGKTVLWRKKVGPARLLLLLLLLPVSIPLFPFYWPSLPPPLLTSSPPPSLSCCWSRRRRGSTCRSRWPRSAACPPTSCSRWRSGAASTRAQPSPCARGPPTSRAGSSTANNGGGKEKSRMVAL